MIKEKKPFLSQHSYYAFKIKYFKSRKNLNTKNKCETPSQILHKVTFR